MSRVVLARAGLMLVAFTIISIAHAGTLILSPPQLSLVNTICSQVIGLRSGDAYFASCRESLSRSLAMKADDQALAAANRACREKGFAFGSAAFATCVLENHDAGVPIAVEPTTIEHPGGASTESNKSFYNISPSMRWDRERYACAYLGLTPGSAAFGQCTDRLDSDFLPNLN